MDGKQIYRATVFYTGKWAKHSKTGAMFMRASSKEEADGKFRATLNKVLIEEGYPQDIFKMDICMVSMEEVENYFRNRETNPCSAVN